MLTHGYRAELREEEDGSWTAEVPELPGSVAAGLSPNEAIAELGDALTAWIEAAQSDQRAVPRPIDPNTDYSGRFVVRLGHSLHRALAVLADREGLSLNAVCQTLLAYGVGRAEPPIWRLAGEHGDLLTGGASLGGRTFLIYHLSEVTSPSPWVYSAIAPGTVRQITSWYVPGSVPELMRPAR